MRNYYLVYCIIGLQILIYNMAGFANPAERGAALPYSAMASVAYGQYTRVSLGKNKAKTDAEVPDVGVVAEPDRHSAVPRDVAPATAAQHAEGAI